MHNALVLLVVVKLGTINGRIAVNAAVMDLKHATDALVMVQNYVINVLVLEACM